MVSGVQSTHLYGLWELTAGERPSKGMTEILFRAEASRQWGTFQKMLWPGGFCIPLQVAQENRTLDPR